MKRWSPGRVLGEGAFGVVYEGRHPDTGARVAIKVLQRLDPEALQRFLREGALLAKVRHPSVLGLIEIGQEEQQPYLVTEFLDGGTLRALLERGEPVAVARAVAIMHDVLAGLEACHAAGVVHRDLKPENILFDAQGRAKVADLGVALAADIVMRLTRTMALVGTPKYMAPEQLKGEDATTASDIYAAGLIAYELLAGYPKAKVPGAAFEAPPIRTLRADVPAGIEEVLARALAKHAADRPPTAAALAAGLARGLRAPSKPVAPPHSGAPARPRRRTALAAAAVVLLLAFLGRGWLNERWRDWRRSRVDPVLADAQRAIDEGRYEQAIALLRPLKRDVRPVITALKMGTAHLRRGHFADAEAEAKKVLELWAQHDGALALMVEIALAKGDAAGALAHARAAVAASPDSELARRTLGQVLMLADKRKEAHVELEKAAAAPQASATTVGLLGTARWRLDGRDQANEAYRRSVELAAGNVEAHLEAGSMMWRCGAGEGANLHFEAAGDRPCRNPELDAYRASWKIARDAQALELQGFEATAIPKRRALVERHPRDVHRRRELAGALVRQGMLREAQKELEAIVAIYPDEVEMIERLSEVQALAGRAQDALATLQRGLAAVPDSPALQRRLPEALALAGRFEDAEKEARALLARQPDHGYVLGWLGRFLALRGRGAEGEPFLRRAATDPSFGHLARETLGLLYQRRGDAAAAERELRAAIASQTRPSESSLSVLASVLTERGANAEALTLRRRAAETYPGSYEASLAYGRLLRLTGRAADAKRELERCRALGPRRRQPLRELGHIARDAGDLAGAEKLYLEALEVDPGTPEVLWDINSTRELIKATASPARTPPAGAPAR
jgi:tetratricopeptide (TPR) repeat protein